MCIIELRYVLTQAISAERLKELNEKMIQGDYSTIIGCKLFLKSMLD